MAEIDLPAIYVVAGLVTALVIALTAAIFASRRAYKSDEIARDAGAAASPIALPTSADESHAERAIESMPAAARDTRELERVPAADRDERKPLGVARAPAEDVPADVAAREGGSAPVSVPPHPHTLAEIQRKPLKPLSSALEKTRGSFFGRLRSIFSQKDVLSAGELEEIEEILYTSDLGPQTVQRLLDAVEAKMKTSGADGFEAVRDAIKAEMLQIFDAIPGNGRSNGHGQASGKANGHGNAHAHDWGKERAMIEHAGEEYLEGLEKLNIWTHKPAVLLVVGVNGAGKTTTIGKLSRRIAQSGRKVLVAAGDTFRAAAGEQLKVWTERAAVEIFSPPGVTDPSAVAFDAIQTAQAKGFDVVIIDTAGRLHTQKNLMEELKKLKRVIAKLGAEAPHETLLVLDANNGQNALQQAREFHGALTVSGVVLTKLDGTAKGGVAVGLACELGLPIKLIGVGEGIEDLRTFSSREFVESII